MAGRRVKVKRGLRRRRSRSGSWRGALRTGVAMAVGVAATVAAVEGFRRASDSTFFSISSVEVVGHRRATEASIRRLSGLAHGAGLFTVDLEDARARVTAHPWVAHARVRLLDVDRIRIAVKEHVPVALVALEHLYYADAKAVLFKRYSPGEGESLPVVTGLDRASMEAVDPGQAELLRSALVLIEAWEVEDHGVLAEVHVSAAHGLTAVIAGSGLTVALGRNDWERRLGQLTEVLSALEHRGLRARRIDLSGRRRTDRAVVRLVREPGTPGPAKAAGQRREDAYAQGRRI